MHVLTRLISILKGDLLHISEFFLCASLSLTFFVLQTLAALDFLYYLFLVLNLRCLPGCDLVPLLFSQVFAQMSPPQKDFVRKVVQLTLLLFYLNIYASLYHLSLLTIISPVLILRMYLTELYAPTCQITYTKLFVIAPHWKQPKRLSVTSEQ